MWRIATAMESAALLLQRSRGRHVPVSVETAKRAQEYIRARVPETAGEPATEDSGAAPASSDAATAAGPSAPGHPNWLSRGAEPIAAAPTGPEVVPISVSDDPSLLPAAPSPPIEASIPPPTASAPTASPRPSPPPRAAPAAPAPPSSPAPAGPISPPIPESSSPTMTGASTPPRPLPTANSPTVIGPIGAPSLPPPPVEPAAVRAQMERELMRRVDDRVQAALALRTGGPDVSEARIAAIIDARLLAFQQEAAARLSKTLGDLDGVVQERLQAQATQTGVQQTESSQSIRHTVERRLQEVAEAESRQIQALHGELEAKLVEVSTQLADQESAIKQGVEESVRAILDDRFGPFTRHSMEAQSRGVEELGSDLRQKLTGLEDRISSQSLIVPPPVDDRIKSAIDQRVSEVKEQWGATLGSTTEALRSELSRKVEEVGARVAAQASVVPPPVDDRIKSAIDLRVSEIKEQWGTNLGRTTEALRAELTRKLEEVGTRVAAQANAVSPEADKRLRALLEERLAQLTDKSLEDKRLNSDQLSESLRTEFGRSFQQIQTQMSQSEDDLRTGLLTQLDLHLREAADREIGMREQLETRVKDSVAQRLLEVESRRAKDAKDLELRMGVVFDGRSRETLEKIQAMLTSQEARQNKLLDERALQLEGRLESGGETRLAEVKEAGVQAVADLQVRMQSYFDQRLREGIDREREKYLELLARLKAELEGAISKTLDTPRFDSAVRDRIRSQVEPMRAETQKLLEERTAAIGEVLKLEQGEATRRLDLLEKDLAGRTQALVRLEETLRADLDDLDRRTQVLADRLVPIVRKTWLRIADVQKGPQTSTDLETHVATLRRDVAREIRRLEGELTERTNELKERMEHAVASQGKVWLTLVRQLSQMSEERRSGTREEDDAESELAEQTRALDEIPDLMGSGARGRGASEHGLRGRESEGEGTLSL
ncbi:MAG: hypothetical protein L3K09_07715, partial [Thermoplasmata archaeon]|nr:hypothetical protein [Thermoplasmata archaeon]